jgi:peptidoglycan/LPS O-acetylase OafA/YrhL
MVPQSSVIPINALPQGRETQETCMAASTKPANADYNRTIDLVRFVAALGIVWDHARAPFADIGYLSLALFLMLTSYFAVGSYDRAAAKGQAAGFWAARAQRILIPWLAWCVFYKALQYYMADDWRDVPFISEWSSLLLGSWIHLWFLPFVMIALAIVPMVARDVRTPATMYSFATVLIVTSAMCGWLHRHLGWPEPWPQWWFSIPLFLFGLFLAIARRNGMPWLPLVTALIASLATVMVEPGFAAFIQEFSDPDRLSTHVTGPGFASVQMILAAIVFEIVWRIRITGSWPTWLAGFAFGIYVLHPFFMLVAFKLFGAGVDRGLAALFTMAAAWAATAILLRLPYLRGLV